MRTERAAAAAANLRAHNYDRIGCTNERVGVRATLMNGCEVARIAEIQNEIALSSLTMIQDEIMWLWNVDAL